MAALLFLPADLAGPHLRKKTIQKLQTLSSLKYATNPCHSRPSLFPPPRLKRTVQIHPYPLALPSFISLHHCLSISVNHMGRLHLLSLVTDSGFFFGCQVVVWDAKWCCRVPSETAHLIHALLMGWIQVNKKLFIIKFSSGIWGRRKIALLSFKSSSWILY